MIENGINCEKKEYDKMNRKFQQMMKLKYLTLFKAFTVLDINYCEIAILIQKIICKPMT